MSGNYTVMLLDNYIQVNVGAGDGEKYDPTNNI